MEINSKKKSRFLRLRAGSPVLVSPFSVAIPARDADEPDRATTLIIGSDEIISLYRAFRKARVLRNREIRKSEK